VVFVYQGTVEQGPMFVDRLIDDVRAVADPEGLLFAAFEVDRGGVREMFGPRSWRSGLRAVARATSSTARSAIR
jgi:hypothetical protein